MSVTRRSFSSWLVKSLAVAAVAPAVGCSKFGLGEPEHKVYAGGGPIPEAGEEIPDEPNKPSRRKTKKR